MPHTNAAGLALIRSFEGCYLFTYDDMDGHDPHPPLMPGDPIRGTPTIGWGSTNQVRPGLRITQAQADERLVGDLAWAEKAVNNAVSRNCTPNQFAALVSFEFNTGALLGSTLLKLFNAGNVAGAADQFLVWNKGGSPLRVMAGLVRRRVAERALFLKP